MTSIQMAAEVPCMSVVPYSAEAGVFILTYSQLAVQRNQLETCQMLLQSGADRFIQDESNT